MLKEINVSEYFTSKDVWSLLVLFGFLSLAGCSTQKADIIIAEEVEDAAEVPEYIMGPGDSIQIFVWHNPDVSITVPVRPDGRISTPLIDNLVVSGKTPTQLSAEIEVLLSHYIKNPLVTVIVTGYVGTFSGQIRVVGEAATPQALPYRSGMSILDVMIEVGGLTEFAAGNRATVVRKQEDGTEKIMRVRLGDLLEDGDISANFQMQPGDILIIPQSYF